LAFVHLAGFVIFLAALYCLVLLYIAAAGGGAWSADKAFLGKKD
jgi:hypothetical protein